MKTKVSMALHADSCTKHLAENDHVIQKRVPQPLQPPPESQRNNRLVEEPVTNGIPQLQLRIKEDLCKTVFEITGRHMTAGYIMSKHS